MRHGRKVALCAGLALTLAALALSWASASPEAMKALAIHEVREKTPAPEVALPTLQGPPLALKELRGKVVLVNFWATWCLPCQWEMPLMERLYQAYRDRGFVVIAISLDQAGAGVVKPFVESRKLTYPVLLDTKLEGATKFGLLGIPATFLIGRDGLIKGVTYGPKEWDGKEARAVIESLLGSAKRGSQEGARPSNAVRSRVLDLRLADWVVRSERGLGPRPGGEVRKGGSAPLRGT